jgi:hypothetical protein
MPAREIGFLAQVDQGDFLAGEQGAADGLRGGAHWLRDRSQRLGRTVLA